MASDIWLRHFELRQRLLDLPRLKVGVPYTGKIIGMVVSHTSFIQSSRSWEIGKPPIGDAVLMN